MRFAEIVKLLAAEVQDQVAYLDKLPENAAVPNFDPCNDVYRMALLFLKSQDVSEGDDGSEGLDHWRSRTEILPGQALPVEWLTIALRMLMDLNRPFLFTRHGLRSAKQWHLVRHLASQVCREMSWSREFRYPNFETLWNALSDGIFDEQIEQRRWLFKNHINNEQRM